MDFGLLFLAGLYLFAMFVAVSFFYQRFRYKRRKRMGKKKWGFYPGSSSMGNALQQLSVLWQPQVQHVLEEKQAEAAEEDDEGAPKDPTAHFLRQAERIRRGGEAGSTHRDPQGLTAKASKLFRMPQTLTAASLVTPARTWTNPVITLDDAGLIVTIETAPSNEDDTILTPTFFDIHFHGAVNHDVMEGTPKAFDTIGRFLATRGVSHFLPTTVTAAVDPTLRALEGIATRIEAGQHQGAIPLGIHLEGPFVSHLKRGVHPPEFIVPPTIELFERFQQAARGHIRLLTIAPEIPGALALIEHATHRGVKISLGHSNATAAETRLALAAGATSATHTFNAMRALDHREPGILGIVLDDESLFAEIICDGVHVEPELVRLFLKAKGLHRAILVTDGMSATGMPDGTYKLGGLEVEVANGRCMANGVLAGSVLTLDRAVANFARFTGTPFTKVTGLASHNPATMLGLEALLSLAPGQPANFNRYTPDGTLQATILHGRQVH